MSENAIDSENISKPVVSEEGGPGKEGGRLHSSVVHQILRKRIYTIDYDNAPEPVVGTHFLERRDWTATSITSSRDFATVIGLSELHSDWRVFQSLSAMQ